MLQTIFASILLALSASAFANDSFNLVIHLDKPILPGAGFGKIGYEATISNDIVQNHAIRCVQSGGLHLE